MKTTVRKNSDSKLKSKEKTKDEASISTKKDEKEKSISKRSISNLGTPRNTLSTPRNTQTTPKNTLTTPRNTSMTPRNYVQKSSTSDIYAQKKNAVQSVKAPRKPIGATNKTSNVSPMKDLLKSSPSSVTQSNKRDENVLKKSKVKETEYSAKKTPRLANDLPYVNVTVNSPASKKKLDLNSERSFKNLERDTVEERKRSKTRTLKEDEVKVLTPDIVDNNAEMLNLSRRLGAQPKAFFVDLEDGHGRSKVQTAVKASDDEVSYEDDFESYESDFESYHSESNLSSNNEHTDGHSDADNKVQSDKDDDNFESDNISKSNVGDNGNIDSEDMKEARDEEKMLDSGNFELRDSQRSANRAKPAVMDFILEGSEVDVKVSLTDEGFQEMSSSSAVSSMKTVHVDVLDRPIFIDFTKGKQNKRKRRIFERLKQRAEDILSMVTLHEMSYSLFEMQPIPYDVYMATFGRSNYMQTAVQTYDDGVSEEVQTDEIESDDKWTQNPVEFSNHDIFLEQEIKTRKYSRNHEDFLTKFTLLLNKTADVDVNNKINTEESYKSNPLRVYFEQKDGVGSGEMLPHESYNSKLKNNEYNVNRLRRFLKKVENKVSNVLSINTGSEDLPDVVKSSKYPFSKGFVTFSNKNVIDEKLTFVSNAKITEIIYPECKNNLILTVHRASNVTSNRCIICLWNLSVARREPVKILTAIDNIVIGRFIGNTDGIFVAALEDGSIHLWDLSEEPMWRNDVASDKKSTKLVEINIGTAMTQIEKDREWNLKNSHVSSDQGSIPCALQACAYTSSACNLLQNSAVDRIVGLQLDCGRASQDAGRKVIGQVCALQRIGVLTIWSLIQEKIKTTADIGKAFWSKMKLEKSQTVSLIEHINVNELSSNSNFNLNAAKRRVLLRKKERNINKKVSRPKSAVNFDRPASAVSVKKQVLPMENNWENGIVCSDLKIMKYDNMDNFLIARNCGEVLCCTRSGGNVKVNKFSVANDSSTVTCLEVSPHNLPYFLAATNVGTVNLCSVIDTRVLLTLDSRNYPEGQEVERYQSDPKGRYMGSVTVKPSQTSPIHTQMVPGISVKSIFWSHVNPCCIYALLREGTLVSWELTHSDIYAASVSERVALAVAVNDDTLALLSPEGEVQVHRLSGETSADKCLQLFTKYVALL